MDIDIELRVGVMKRGEDHPYEDEATLRIRPDENAEKMALRLDYGETFTVGLDEMQTVIDLMKMKHR